MVVPVGASLVDLEALTNHLAHLDHGAALAVVEGARADGASIESIITGLLSPALVEVGRRWAANEIGAAEALAAAAIARSAIPRAPSPPSNLNRRSVAVCCPPGEHHEIPAEMVTELLRAEGCPAQHLGAGVTPKHLPGFLSRQRPAALLISCTSPCGLPGAARSIEVSHAYGVPVIVGGAAFGRDALLALRLGAAAWAPSARHAIGIMDSWESRPKALPTGRALSEEYLMYEAGLPQIRAGVVTSLRRMAGDDGGDDPDGVADTQDRLELLLRHLGAALLVDDGRLFLDFLSWRAEYYSHRNIGPERLSNLMSAVSAAMPSEFSRARRFVEEGRQHVSWLLPAAGGGGVDWMGDRFSSADNLTARPVTGLDASPDLAGDGLSGGRFSGGGVPGGGVSGGGVSGGGVSGGGVPGGGVSGGARAAGGGVARDALGGTGRASEGFSSGSPFGGGGRSTVAAPATGDASAIATAGGAALPSGSAPPRPLVSPDQRGRVFADLLFVAATTCHAPFALISVAQPDGRWSTLGHGVDRRDLLADDRLLAAIGRSTDPVQISDLSLHPDLGTGPLARGPLGVKFVYGIPLRSRQNTLLGVLCVLDRRSRDLSTRERQALTAIARQVAGQLAMWRRGGSSSSAPVAVASSLRSALPAPSAMPAAALAQTAMLAPSVLSAATASMVSADAGRHDVGRPAEAAPERPLLHLHRDGGDELLRSHEVAVLFDVTDRTVINWAAANKLPSIRTAGGHLRFRGDDVLALLAGRPVSDGRSA